MFRTSESVRRHRREEGEKKDVGIVTENIIKLI